MAGSAWPLTMPMRSTGLYAYAGYQIDLEFEPGETFVGLGAGDLEALTFVGQDNHLFLKPKARQRSRPI